MYSKFQDKNGTQQFFVVKCANVLVCQLLMSQLCQLEGVMPSISAMFSCCMMYFPSLVSDIPFLIL